MRCSVEILGSDQSICNFRCTGYTCLPSDEITILSGKISTSLDKTEDYFFRQNQSFLMNFQANWFISVRLFPLCQAKWHFCKTKWPFCLTDLFSHFVRQNDIFVRQNNHFAWQNGPPVLMSEMANFLQLATSFSKNQLF